MLAFLIKKSFFDAWDNLGVIILANLAMMLVFTGGLWPTLRVLENGNPAGFLMLVVVVLLFFILLGTVSSITSQLADYRRAGWGDALQFLRKGWKLNLLFAFSLAAFFIASFFGIHYYLRTGTTLGFAAAAFLFWVDVAAYLLSIWFFPARNRLTGGFKKLLKKSALIMFDNLGLSLFTGFVVIPLQIVLWSLTAFAAFGPAGIQLYLNDAMRILMFKYDWLEENPGKKRRDVPWYELLVEERERVGPRTLKGLIFPWKE